jgi:hypothetical protein
VFQETIISGFIDNNGSGAGINWDLIKRSLSGLRNLARTYENDRGKHDRLKRLVKHVETLVGLQRSDGLPVHIIPRHRPFLQVEPNLYEASKCLELQDFLPVQVMGFDVHHQFFVDFVNGRWRLKMEGETVPRGDDCIGFLAKKLGNDRVALRDLSRAVNQNSFGDVGARLSSFSTYSDFLRGKIRPMFAAPNGYGILTVAGGDDGNWDFADVHIRRRKRGDVVNEFEVTFTNRWRPQYLMYYDFSTGAPNARMAHATRSLVQRMDLEVRADLVRAGENFYPELKYAMFTVYIRPMARQDDGTPEWMLSDEAVK